MVGVCVEQQIRYKVLTINLANAHDKDEYKLPGYNLSVLTISGSATCQIRFNKQTGESVELSKVKVIESKFQAFYITNSVQTGKTITLIIGEQNFKLFPGITEEKPDLIIRSSSEYSTGTKDLWTPSAGKKFRLKGGIISVHGNGSGAGHETITLIEESLGSIGLAFHCWLVSSNLSSESTIFQCPFDLGDGYLATTADKKLQFSIGKALAMGKVTVIVWGTEE